MTITAQIKPIDGKDALVLCADGETANVAIPPAEGTIDAACEMLADKSGVSKPELVSAAIQALNRDEPTGAV